MGLREILDRFKRRREMYKEYEEQQRMVQKFEEKSKSANERELERFMKEEREDNIKKELEEFRKKRQVEAQYGNQILKAKNMFNREKQVILNSPSMMRNDKRILKGGKLFFK